MFEIEHKTFFSTLEACSSHLKQIKEPNQLFKQYKISNNIVQQSNNFQKESNKIIQTINGNEQKIKELINISKSSHPDESKIKHLMISIKTEIDAINCSINNLKIFVCDLNEKYKNLNNNHNYDHHNTILHIIENKIKHCVVLFANGCDLGMKCLQKQKQYHLKFGDTRLNNFRKVPRNRRRQQQQRQNAHDDNQSLFVLNPNDNTNANTNNGQLVSQSQMIANEKSYYEKQRFDDALIIEKQLTEINKMTIQLAQLVAEQREVIIYIPQNLETAHDNIENATIELQKTLNDLSSNGWLLIKVLIVIIVFAVVFTIFVV